MHFSEAAPISRDLAYCGPPVAQSSPCRSLRDDVPLAERGAGRMGSCGKISQSKTQDGRGSPLGSSTRRVVTLP